MSISLFSALLGGFLVSISAVAQSAPESIAQTLNVYVFPNEGQTPEQQSKDEGYCYNWAVTNSGVDPFKTKKTEQQANQQAATDQQNINAAGAGAGARGALRGAAAGALVGELAGGSAGEGAAWGAAVGGIANRRRTRRAQELASEQVSSEQQQTQEVSAQDMTNFKKAFSLCLEAKKYMVKY